MSTWREIAQEKRRADGKRAYYWGEPYNRLRDVEWRKGWNEAQQSTLKERAEKQERLNSLLDEAEHRAMLQRAELMKRGAGGRWTVLGR